MRIRLDECLSFRVAEALKGFTANRPGFDISHVRDDNPPGTSDPVWIKKFAAEGGQVVISGDTNILRHWPNLIAYKETGLIGFFPPKKWDQLRGAGQAALLIRWWPTIIEKAKQSERGECWQLPLIWSPEPEKLKGLDDPRFKSSSFTDNANIVPLPTRHSLKGK